MPLSNSSLSGDEDQIVDVFPETPCLFCAVEFKDPLEIYKHCLVDHSFNIFQILDSQKCDTFDYIKLINFIRTNIKENPNCQINLLLEQYNWKDDKYMKPIHMMDSLLMLDVDDIIEMTQGTFITQSAPVQLSSNISNGTLPCQGVVPPLKRIKNDQGDIQSESLSRTTQELKEKIQFLEETLASMKENMKALSQKLLEFSSSSTNNTGESGSYQGYNTSNPAAESDNNYFNSYAYISIHEDMLKDTVRTGSYRDAITVKDPLQSDAVPVFKHQLVLDVGCGTGILSMLSARAGAKLTMAVDQSDIIYEAMDIAKENGLDDKITFIKGKVEEITLPVEKVDIIVSEWMGYFLLSESMMSSVIHARDKWLAPGGLMVPSRLRLFLQPITDKASHDDKLSYWDDVYGFKMSCLKKIKKREIDLDDLYTKMSKDPSIKLLADPFLIKDVNMVEIREDQMEVKNLPFEFVSTFEGQTQELTAFICYFDTNFYPDNSPHQVSFSTGPTSPPTHWKQTVLHIPDTLIVKKGESIKGTISMTQLPHDTRTWCIEIDMGPTRQYMFDLS